MDLLRTAVVHITTLVAACHALKCVPAEDAEALQRKLRNRLRRYMARSSDLGAGVLQQLALARPEELLGLRLSGTNPYVAAVQGDLSPAEVEFVKNASNGCSPRWPMPKCMQANRRRLPTV
jgi:hypothetical protein